MKKQIIVGVVALSMAFCAQAVPITGGISLAGGYTTDTGNLNTADAFATFTAVQVTGASGSFSGVTLNTAGSVTMNGFSFDPFPVGGVLPLWSTVAGITASFDLLSINPVQQPGDNSLKITGSGVFHITGFDDTFGTYIFTANQSGGTFSFSSSQEALDRVPDGGSTVALLGLALAGAAFFRRRIAA
jgi:hypothetical protein